MAWFRKAEAAHDHSIELRQARHVTGGGPYMILEKGQDFSPRPIISNRERVPPETWSPNENVPWLLLPILNASLDLVEVD